MKYILLINVPADVKAEPDMTERHAAFAQATAERGKLVSGDRLGVCAESDLNSSRLASR